MMLNPPPHICGINLPAAARADRDRWVASLPPHVSTARLAAMLGISQRSVLKHYPLRSTGKVPAAVMPPTAVPVSLPQVPGVEVTRDRPETNPRAGIVSLKRDYKAAADDDRPATVGFVMDYLRSLRAEVKAKGDAA